MSRTKIDVVKGDKLYFLNFTLQTAAGVAVDLTGSTLLFKVQKSGATALKFSGSMTIVLAASGTCKYQVQATDFDAIGTYNAEIEVSRPGSEIITFSDIVLTVKDDLPK